MKKSPRFLFGSLVLLTLWMAPAAHAVEVSFEQDSSLPLVHVNLAIRAGSVTDPSNMPGLTNFVGRMLLRGTKKRSKEQIDVAIDQMGAALDVETRAESIIVRGSVLSAQLDSFLALMGEVVTQPSFPEREIRKLKSEIGSDILEELGQDSGLGSRWYTYALFDGGPFGQPIEGTQPSIAAMTRAKAFAQYQKIFQGKYLLVVGTGDAAPSKISAWANSLSIAQGSTDKSVEASALETPKNPPSKRLLIVDKPDRTQTQIFIGQVGTVMTSPDYFPLYLANHAFGGGSFNARLMIEIRVKRGWSYGAYSGFRFGTVPRSWTTHLFPATKDTPSALGLTYQMLRDFHDHGITQAEFDFARGSLINNSGFDYDTPAKRVENKLLERTLDLPDGFMKTYADHLSKLQLTQVNDAVKHFVDPDHMTTVVVATASQVKDDLAKAVGVPADQVAVVPYAAELKQPWAKK